MFGIDSGFIMLQALLLMGLLFLFARHEADFEYSTVLLVMCGIIAGNFLIFISGLEYFGLFVVIPIFAFTCWMIAQFCWVPWRKALLITFLYFILAGGYETGVVWYRTGSLPWNVVEESGSQEAMTNYERDMQEGLEVFNDITEGTARMVAAGEGRPLPPVDDDEPEASTTPVLAAERAALPPKNEPPGTVSLPIPSPPASVPAQAAAKPLLDEGWVMAKSLLRIRGWVEDVDGTRTAMVNDQEVPVGGTVHVEYKGVRYTWRLAALHGYVPQWEPVGKGPVARP